MKKLIFASAGMALLFAVSCKKADDLVPNKELIVTPGVLVDTLKGDVTVNTVVTRTTYLKGIVYVRPGVTLTINAGVTIKGSDGVVDLVNLANDKGTLVIEKGGKLIANGTANSPIIWTSEKASGSRSYGDWGGLVILGNAPIITATGATTNNFEAFAALVNGRNSYGGTVPADNSGSVTYNRFEFGGGIVTAPNAEVNGVTLCGVGNGTAFHHNEVSNAGDDGFEFFGGTVNVNHLLSFGNKDDDFDFDEAYSGNLQFIIAFRNDLADNSGSEMIELDNNAQATLAAPHTTPFIANATLIGPTSTVVRPGSGGRFDGGVYVRRAGRIRLVNSLIIAQAFPTALASTPSTNDALVNPANSDPSYIRNNIFQTASAHPVVLDDDESNQILDGTSTDDNALIAFLSNGTNANSAVAGYADFKLGDYLNLLPGSPALTGGLNLPANGIPGFVGTSARGAVIPGDQWTAAPWISIATN